MAIDHIQTVGKQRISSIDILRGLIMLIMAIDHTRDFVYFTGSQFSPIDMVTTTPANGTAIINECTSNGG